LFVSKNGTNEEIDVRSFKGLLKEIDLGKLNKILKYLLVI
jgi:hypothetical protein